MLFWDQFAQKRGHYGPQPKWKTIFLAEITKADHQPSQTFYFIKISYVLIELWIFFFLEWCLLSRKCNFQPKQLMLIRPSYVCNKYQKIGSCRLKNDILLYLASVTNASVIYQSVIYQEIMLHCAIFWFKWFQVLEVSENETSKNVFTPYIFTS